MWSNIINKSGESFEKRKRIDDPVFWESWDELEEIIGEEKKMVEHKKLSVGDKYYTIEVEIGGQKFRWSAFKNEAFGSKPGQPFAKGNNVALFVNIKKADNNKSEKDVMDL